MIPLLIIAAIVVSGVGSLVFSTLSYALRDVSRVRLGDYLERHGRSKWFEPTLTYSIDLIFVTAVGRMLCNTVLLLGCLGLADWAFTSTAARYGSAAGLAVVLTLVTSILLPDAISRHIGDILIGVFARPLHALRWLLSPITRLVHLSDRTMRRAIGITDAAQTQQKMELNIQQEILSVVEEGEKEGVVDEQEREMIESVIELRDTTAGQIMTPRPEVVAVDISSTLSHVKQTLEQSGHSRLPVYKETLDHVVGILYARDLLKHLGQPPERFDMRSAIRPAVFVPEVKPLPDLLRDFKLQKVHIAMVLDEYGGMVGLITIEDILEELVGEISDEHEPVEPDMFKRLDEQTAEADARIYVDELNRLLSLDLPEDAGYDTLGGFVSTALGKIPQTGTSFQQNGARFTILDAEPQKVNRVQIELLHQPIESADAAR